MPRSSLVDDVLLTAAISVRSRPVSYRRDRSLKQLLVFDAETLLLAAASFIFAGSGEASELILIVARTVGWMIVLTGLSVTTIWATVRRHRGHPH